MLNYFSRNNGFILKNLVKLDTQIQQTNEKKINFIKENQDQFFDKIEFICYNKNLEKNCTEEFVDEIYIRNTIKEAWKNLENLDKNISLFKDNLLNGKVDNKNPLKLFSNNNNNNENKDKDFKALSGDGTNRLASRKLNSMNKNQLKSLQKLEMFCGVKKEEKDNIKLIMEINSKMEGNRENSITKELKAANKINNKTDEKKENNEEKKDNNEEKKDNENNNNDNNDSNKNVISNNNNENNTEQPKKKFKRPKHSLKNLLE
jgi:hypothetical protein